MRARRWVVVRAGHGLRWGGEHRRMRLLEVLAARTGAAVIDGMKPDDLVAGFAAARPPFPARLAAPRPLLAASEALPLKALEIARKSADLAVVAIYDEPVAQTHALGVAVSAEQAATVMAQRRANLDAFRWYVVPTASFAEFAGLDAGHVIVGGNGTDTDAIRPGPWPERPAIGFASGATPGRGIEVLVEAARLVRQVVPDLHLLLWLVPTSEASRRYLGQLAEHVRAEPWIRIETVSHDARSDAFARATVMCVPHPRADYLDVALPVKLLDAMAAGRPLVVTPRRETVALVERAGCGLVAGGDHAEDLAAPLRRVLESPVLAQRLGAAGRLAAEREHDWRVVGARVADAILERTRQPTG